MERPRPADIKRLPRAQKPLLPGAKKEKRKKKPKKPSAGTQIKRLKWDNSQPRANRKCGKCRACCTTLGVDELDKPAGVRCSFLNENKGCTIYQDRPEVCSAYSCMWLAGWLRNKDKPNRIGIVIDQPSSMKDDPLWKDIEFAVVRKVVPGLKLSKGADEIISAMKKQMVVVFINGDKRQVLGPNGLVNEIARRTRVRQECKHPRVSAFPEAKCEDCGLRGALNPQQAKKFVDLLKRPPVIKFEDDK